MILCFSAEWCPPCKEIAPKYEAWAGQFHDVEFYKVDVDNDDAQDLLERCLPDAMPTFKFFQRGNEIESLKGAD